MNIKKLFAVLAGVSFTAQTLLPVGVMGATYSQELQGAYDWAYAKGVTTQSPIDNANMYGAITRAEMAKMLSVYAEKVLGLTADEAASCNFTDIDSVKGDLHDYIIKSCKLGIMGQKISAFRPYDTLSRAEFGTALSRVLWGNKYEGGTPYYANHLNALKAAGIMNQIANAEQTKEVRGYVMLMLQRSEASEGGVDCDDPVITIACLDPELDAYKECPAACREDAKDEDKVVKSGDLAITAKATEGRKVVVPGVSDTDTITFKSSEEVEITKVVLERYGYSDADLVDEVRLEDQDGNVIADGKSLSKDKATLTIKKDYRKTDGTLNATIVVSTTGGKVGGTIGFKVVDVESSAKNLNLEDYTPYTYDTVTYSGAVVTVDIKGTKKDYNYEEGESYEIARLKVKAGSSIISVRGFTLTNGGNLDMDKFLKKLTVKVDGSEVDGVKYSVNKDDELVISFDELTIDMNKSKLFVISASLEDFEDYGDNVAYYLASQSNINAIEKKTGARLAVEGSYGKNDAISHAFKGGKIKLSNNKLGKIDASQGSEDVVVAEGDITITEGINKLQFTVEASGSGAAYVTALRMFVGDDDEFEAKKNGTKFTFSNVEIAKSGKVQFKIDILDKDEAQGKIIKLSPNFNSDSFKSSKYESSREEVNTGDVSGTISFSEITIQAAKASLKNNLSKDVEFLNNDTTKGIVFEGTYSAKKALVNLNKFYMSGAANPNKVKITYTLFVNDKEVASTDGYGSGAQEMFDDIKVRAGESVDVRVEAEVEAYGSKATLKDIYLVLGGTDEFSKDVEDKATKIMGIKIVDQGNVSIESPSSAKTVLYKAKNQKIAEFTVKPADGASSVDIERITFNMSNATPDDVSLMFGNTVIDSDSDTAFDYDVKSNAKGTIGTEGISIKVMLDEEKDGAVTLSGFKVNDKSVSKEFVSRFEPAVVSISKQENLGGGTTKFSFNVKKDSDITITGLKVTLENNISGAYENEVDGTSFIEVKNTTDVDQNVTMIEYYISSSDYTAGTSASCAGAKDVTGYQDTCTGSVGTWSGTDNKCYTGATPTEVSAADACNATAGYTWNTTLSKCLTTADKAAQPDNQTDCEGAAGTWTPATSASGMAPKKVTICKTAGCASGELGYSDFFLVGGVYAKAFPKKS